MDRLLPLGPPHRAVQREKLELLPFHQNAPLSEKYSGDSTYIGTVREKHLELALAFGFVLFYGAPAIVAPPHRMVQFFPLCWRGVVAGGGETIRKG